MAEAAKRRGLRFGLRTLILMLTLAAVASWAYWDGWVKWSLYREHQEFLAQAMELKRGRLIGELWRPKLKSYGPPFVSDDGGHDGKGQYTRYLACRWPNALYVVFWRFEDSHCSSVEVFRLPAAPKNYIAKTNRSRIATGLRSAWIANTDPRRGRPYRDADDASQLAYKLDFVDMITGDRRDPLGFKHVLLYSDLPAAELHK